MELSKYEENIDVKLALNKAQTDQQKFVSL